MDAGRAAWLDYGLGVVRPLPTGGGPGMPMTNAVEFVGAQYPYPWSGGVPCTLHEQSAHGGWLLWPEMGSVMVMV